ncbi:MAG: hypothetical protein R6U44_00355 [Archaeoglobaceae archaeon]
MKGKLLTLTLICVILVTLVSGCTQKETKNGTIEIQGHEVSRECEADKDCVLVNKQLNYSSCWPGACEEIDYSLSRYIAVNQDSFEDFKEIVGPSRDECGLKPLCPIKIVNDNFTASCVDNICVKVPITEK